MPLGASITHGLHSTDGNGYREALRDQLKGKGKSVTMVGNNPNGTMENNQNEGWPGYVIEEVEGKGNISIPDTKPNLVLINAGTNDAVQDKDVDNAHVRIDSLLDSIYDKSSRATVLLSTLLVNGDEKAEANCLKINQQIKDVVSARQDKDRIVLVDFRGDGGLTIEDINTDDGTHPTDKGYQKMVPLWIKGVEEAESKGFLQAPESTS